MLRRLIGIAPGFIACLALWVAGEWLVAATGLSLPGGVVGFALLLGLIALMPRYFPIIARGAEPLLDNLMLFFLPAVLSIIAYPELFGLLGLKLLGALIVGTMAMMATVGMLAEWLMRGRGATEEASGE